MTTESKLINLDLTRQLGDKVITDAEIDKFDTFIVKDKKLIKIPKWIVKSEPMKHHGKIISKSMHLIIEENNERLLFINNNGSLNSSSLDDTESGDQIIVFDVKLSEEIWKTSLDNFTLEGLHDLLTAFQIFDIKLTAATQRKIAFNYLAEARERGENDWNIINNFDIGIFEECAFLCGTGILDMVSKDTQLTKLDSYFAGRKPNYDQKVDLERIKTFLTKIKEFPKFEPIIDSDTFVRMLTLCMDMEYYYLFSEIYCTVISTPGSTFIFNLEVAKIYSKWVNTFRMDANIKYITVKDQGDEKQCLVENPRHEEYRKNDRAHETFQHMAVKYSYILEILCMYKKSCEKIELTPDLNFLCPCYMVPIRKHKTPGINSCDYYKCSCKSIILPIDEIKKRLNIFIGGYLNDLDLSKSAITGSAMTACPIITKYETRCKNFEEFIDIFYGKTTTIPEFPDFNRFLSNYYEFYQEGDEKNNQIKEGKLLVARQSFKITGGTDVDILVNTNDIKEFDMIAEKHINVIRKHYPQVMIKQIVVHSGGHKYKVQFPNHEQRDVEIYMASVDNIVSYHLGCVRAYYSSIHENRSEFIRSNASGAMISSRNQELDESSLSRGRLTCFPSYLMTMISRKSPDIRFVPGSKSIEAIMKKYELRGIETLNDKALRFMDHLTHYNIMHNVANIGKHWDIVIDIRNIIKILKMLLTPSKHIGHQFNESIEYNICKSLEFYGATGIAKEFNEQLRQLTPCYHLLHLISYNRFFEKNEELTKISNP